MFVVLVVYVCLSVRANCLLCFCAAVLRCLHFYTDLAAGVFGLYSILLSLDNVV